MKLKTVAMISALGMISSSAAAYVLAEKGPVARIELAGLATSVTPATPTAPVDRFVAGEGIRVEGRLGHARLTQTGPRSTYVMLEVTASSGVTTKGRAPLNIALVIDRSGSMKGSRMQNAIDAAVGLVDGLADGDVVSAVSFDTQTQLVVPATEVTAQSRPDITAALRGIALGGDTCISCGIERARTELLVTHDRVDRMIVLSDGRANHGVVDPAGLGRLAERAREDDLAITTVGLGFDYNAETLASLAASSNGAHHFVPDEAALDGVFAAEARAAASAVAAECMAEIELSEGVELVEVVDRAHRREGRRLMVPLGSLSVGERKTVLLELRLRDAALAGGMADVATASLRYRQPTEQTPAEPLVGRLALAMSDEPSSALDPLVDLRLQRRRTATALRESSRLFTRGQIAEARRLLEDKRIQIERLRDRLATDDVAKNDARVADIARDLEKQLKDTDASLATLVQSRAVRGPTRKRFKLKNVEMMNPYML